MSRTAEELELRLAEAERLLRDARTDRMNDSEWFVRRRDWLLKMVAPTSSPTTEGMASEYQPAPVERHARPWMKLAPCGRKVTSPAERGETGLLGAFARHAAECGDCRGRRNTHPFVPCDHPAGSGCASLVLCHGFGCGQSRSSVVHAEPAALPLGHAFFSYSQVGDICRAMVNGYECKRPRSAHENGGK